jgi:NAD-specific glutamate dehydrogenase
LLESQLASLVSLDEELQVKREALLQQQQERLSAFAMQARTIYEQQRYNLRLSLSVDHHLPFLFVVYFVVMKKRKKSNDKKKPNNCY